MTHAPLLEGHYSLFITTTGMSAPTFQCVLKVGSHVPQIALGRTPAALTPDAVQTVDRLSSAPCSGDGCTAPFGHHQRFRRFIGRFTFVRLCDPYVTVVFPPFPCSLTTFPIEGEPHQGRLISVPVDPDRRARPPCNLKFRFMLLVLGFHKRTPFVTHTSSSWRLTSSGGWRFRPRYCRSR